MADLTKEQLRKAGTVTITDSSTGNVSKVIAPNSLEVGLDDSEFKKNLTVYGAATVHQGITGSITKLPDGSSFLRDGTNITTTVGPDGSITIASIGAAASNVGHTILVGAGLYPYGTNWDGSSGMNLTAKTDDVTIRNDRGTDSRSLAVLKVPNTLSVDSAGGLTGGAFDGNAAITNWGVLKKTEGGLNSDTYGLFIDINSETTSSSTATDKILIYQAGAGLRKISLQQVANLANTGFAGSTTNTLVDGNGISDFSFDGSSSGVQVAVEAADATISVASAGVRVLKVPFHLTNSSGIAEFTYDGSVAGASISLDIASNSGLSLNAQKLALNFSKISTAAIDDADFVPFYDTSGGTTGLGKVLFSDFKSDIVGSLTIATPWIDLGKNLQTTSSVALAGDHGAAYSVTDVGNDVYFFVSGSKYGKGISARTVSAFAGDVVVTGSLYVDSSQVLVGGSGYVNFGSVLGNAGYGVRSNAGVLQYKNSSGAWVNFGTTSSPKADPDAQYLVLAATSSLNSERVMTVSTGLSAVDSGAGAAYTLSVDDSVVATLTGSEFSGIVKLNSVTSASNMLPIADSTYTIGNENLRWKSISTNQISYEVNAGNSDNYNTINLNADSMPSNRDNSIYIQSVQSVLMALDSNDGNTGNYFAIFNNVGTSSIESTSVTDAVFKVAESGRVYSQGVITSSAGFSGSLTHLSDGSSYLVAGENVSIISSSAGSVTINSYAAGGGSPGGGNSDKAAQYLVLAATASLVAERVINISTGLSSSDAGPGGNYTITADNSIVATLTGSQFSSNIGVTGSIGSTTKITSPAFSGSLTHLQDGTSYLKAGTNITVASASNGSITIASTNTTYTAGDGLDLSGTVFSTDLKSSGGLKIESTELAVDNSVVATLTGSQFSSNVGVTGSLGVTATITSPAISGSLTRLSDGTSYIKAGSNITVTSASNGSVTITSTGTDTTYTAGDGLDLTGTVFSTDLKSSGGLKIDSTELAIDDSVVATISGSTFTGAVKFNSGLSGSLTHLTDGTSYLIAGSNITIATGSSGAITVAASGGEITVSSGSTSVSSVTSIDFTNAGILQDLGSGTVALTGSIGSSEDGTYTDGLFTDFTTVTPVGTAVDRFNEVLKGLAPSAAPALDDMDCDDSGTNAVLSFGSSQSISGYTNAIPSGLTPTDNLSDVDINGTFSSTTSNNDIRVACFAGSTTVEGTLNEDISADGVNYPANSFGDGDSGTLYLYVNDNSTEIHSVDLSSFGSGNSLNGNGSGFFDLSAADPGHFSDSSEFATFKHRTGSFRVTTTDQRDGWNYARVTHVIGATTNTCNYVEWVNDPNANALSSEGSAIDSLSMTGTKNLSGVKYNTGGTAEYRIRALNAYRNVYSTSTISFNDTRCSVSSQAFPAIDYAGGEDETKILHITGSVTITSDPILNQSITVSTNVPHPLKSNLSSAGSESIAGILLYDLSDTSTTTSETFRGEGYRLLSGSYNAQSDTTSGGNAWDSTTSLVGIDGLLFYNSRLYAPVQGGSSGDFRNTTDGGSITNGPSSNVNYSGLTSGLRTFYRYLKNTSGGSKTGFSLTINGSGTIASQPTALSTSNLHVLLKLPTTGDGFNTGWMDLAIAFATGQTSDGDGCLDGSLDSSLSAINTATFGTQSVGSNEYVMIKIEADASFTGYISSLSISWS